MLRNSEAFDPATLRLENRVAYKKSGTIQYRQYGRIACRLPGNENGFNVSSACVSQFGWTGFIVNLACFEVSELVEGQICYLQITSLGSTDWPTTLVFL